MSNDFTLGYTTPRRNMLDVCGQCNVSKKSGHKSSEKISPVMR